MKDLNERDRFHPTCHRIPLQTGAKLIALMDMVFGLIGIVWFIYMLERYSLISLDPFETVGVNTNSTSEKNLKELGVISAGPVDGGQEEQVYALNHKVISLTLSGFYTMVNLGVFVVLLIGAHQKSIGKCLAWFYIRAVILVFKLIFTIMYLIAGRPIYSQIPFIIFMIVHAYGLWLVSCFIDEIREQQLQEQLDEIEFKKAQNFYNDPDPNGIESLRKEQREEIQKHGSESHHDNEAFSEH